MFVVSIGFKMLMLQDTTDWLTPCLEFCSDRLVLCVLLRYYHHLREVSDRFDVMNFWECELLYNYACQFLANLCRTSIYLLCFERAMSC